MDTVEVRVVARPPAPDGRVDSTSWGLPQIRVRTGQGDARVWLLRAADTVFVAILVPDRSRSWSDAMAICLDVAGDRAPSPAHDDFQWSLQRVLDSSVVYRGRAGRWQPPLDDPDWRVGAARSGGGWEVASADDAAGWSVVLRLDPAWMNSAEPGRRPGIGIRIHDDDPNGWYSWPQVRSAEGAPLLERTPALWAALR
jgi:hypothetical protein